MTRPRPHSPVAIRKLLCEAAAKSGLSMAEIGMRMGYSKEGARQAVARMLGKDECDPRLSALIAFSEAVNKPLKNLLP